MPAAMETPRRTKIIATLGPATAQPGVTADLVAAGVDVFRANFSFATQDDHARAIEAVREEEARQGRTVAILQDLQGPRIRVGSLPGGSIELREGTQVTLSGPQPDGGENTIPTSYAELARDVEPGQRILLDNGLLELRALRVRGDGVECAVVHGGPLAEEKGINLPGAKLSAPPFSEKDAADLLFGLEAGADLVALSFVRTASDADAPRDLMGRTGRSVPLLAKIEKAEALSDLASIIRRFDGIMIARGDLGVELPAELVPVIQKRLIDAANSAGKPVITATQMLESMTNSPRPTRAEASDVANAVIDGTDAVMLSGETAIGRYPAEAVRAMDRIAREAERMPAGLPTRERPRTSRAHAVCHAAVALANEVKAAALAAFTHTGRTAQILSSLRPAAPVFAFCEDVATARRLGLWRGIVPLTMSMAPDVDRTTELIAGELRRREFVSAGEDVVVVGASRAGGDRRTNLVRLLRIRDG